MTRAVPPSRWRRSAPAILLGLALAGLPAASGAAWGPASGGSDETEPIGIIGGRVVDHDSGLPLAGEPVWLTRTTAEPDRRYPHPWVPESGLQARETQQAITGADGAFAFDGLVAGRYRLRIDLELTTPLGPMLVGHDAPTYTAELRVVLGRHLSGTVLRPDGSRAGGAAVLVAGLEAEDGSNALWDGPPPGRHAREDGTFLLAALPSGDLWLEAFHPEHGFSPPSRVAADVERDAALELRLREERDRLASLGGESFGGIGVQVAAGPTGPRIEAVTPELPASLAGVQVGDVVVEVDGHATGFMPFDEFLMRCRGPVGRSLTLRHERGGVTMDVELVRVAIP